MKNLLCYHEKGSETVRVEKSYDKAYGACILLTFLDFKTVSMNTSQFKQMMNLIISLVCNILNSFFIFLWRGKFSTSVDGSRIMGIIGIK